MNDPDSRIDDPDSRREMSQRLSQMLSLDGEPTGLWRPEELSGILRHQLEVPLDLELILRDDSTPASSKEGPTSAERAYPSLAALLADSAAPLPLLKRLKDYTKAAGANPDSPLPEEIATLLYFAAIAAAFVHHATRISGLGNDGLQWGFSWALGETWVADELRSLFTDALTRLEG